MTWLNVVTSLGAYAVSLSVGLLYTPFLVHALGIATYGLIPLSFSIIQYFGPITQTLSLTLNQRLSASRSTNQLFNNFFSLFMVLCALFALIVLILLVPLSFTIDNFLNVPKESRRDATILFSATVVAFSASILTMPFSSIVFAYNSIYILNAKQAVEVALRALLVVILFLSISPTLQFVALATILAAVAGGILVIIWALHLRPDTRFNFRGLPWRETRSLTKTGGAIGLTQIGTLLLLNSDLIIVNAIYGATMGGGYAAVAQWAAVLRGLVLSVSSTVTAKIMHDYHLLSSEDVLKQLCQVIRILTAFASLPTGFIAGISPYLLQTWIGPPVSSYATTLSILALPTAINLAVVPVLSVSIAADRIGAIGVSYFIGGLLFVASSIAASLYFPFGGSEIAAVLAFFLIGKNYIYIFPTVGRFFGKGAHRQIVIASLYSVIWTAWAILLTRLLAEWVAPAGFVAIGVIGLAITPPYVIFVLIMSPRGDRRLITRLVPGITIH